jgi:tetratricopeptide (TPR) repeat protein
MKRLIEQNTRMALVVAFLAALGTTPAAAQEGAGVGDRITIMVPDLAPRNGVNNRFGERVAEDIRDMINDLHTHQTVSGRDIRDARREYDLAHEDLFDCIRARQLAMRMGWGLVLCGEYQQSSGGEVAVNAKFVGSENGHEFAVDPFTISEREHEQAAQNILQAFDRYQNQLRHTVFCQQYMDSENFERALENCDQALAIDDSNPSPLYMKAYILREMERYDESLQTLDRLLEVDPIHQDALKLAGIVSTQADNRDQARSYFDRYLELNPNDPGVRLAIATDIANAGDPAAAMMIAQEGLEIEPDNLTLRTYIAHFAIQAASKAEAAMNQTPGQAPVEGPTVDPAAIQDYYATAVENYQVVFEAKADSTEAQILERLTIAQFKLGQYEEATQTATRAVGLYPDNPALWEVNSRALQEAGRPREALTALERAEELGQSGASVLQRKAMLQLEMGSESAAVSALNQGVQAGTLEPSQAFNIIFGHAFNDKYKQGQLNAAFDLIEAAGPLATTERDRLTRNFWRGYIRYEQARAAHEPMTAASAQRAKPLFEQALQLFQAAQGYEQYHASANVPQLIDATRRFIEIEEALIKRGR